jgi:CheY-like chemotaxis protein
MNTQNEQISYLGEILVVDDAPVNLKLLATLLRRENYNIRCATGGAMALRSAQDSPPDLILLDITMPDMDGYEVCRRLKAEPETAKIPVIFVSALDASAEQERVRAAGGVGYISKPYQIQDVLVSVQDAFKSVSTHVSPDRASFANA